MTLLAPVRALVPAPARARAERGNESEVRHGRRPESPLSRSGDASGGGVAGSPVSGPTLDELVVHVWDELMVDGVSHCPLCDGQMAREHSGGGRRIACRCHGCETVLS